LREVKNPFEAVRWQMVLGSMDVSPIFSIIVADVDSTSTAMTAMTASQSDVTDECYNDRKTEGRLIHFLAVRRYRKCEPDRKIIRGDSCHFIIAVRSAKETQ